MHCRIHCMFINHDILFLSAERTGANNLNPVAENKQKQRSASINDYEVFHDSSANTWHVVGAGSQRFVQMTNWQYVLTLEFWL